MFTPLSMVDKQNPKASIRKTINPTILRKTKSNDLINPKESDIKPQLTS
jgi:hypothetical protein